MKKLIYTAICASLMFGLSSCQNDESSANEGAITIAANIDDSPMVRSAETDTELKNNAKVNIYLPSYGGRIRQYTYSDMPEIIYLPAGNGYRVDVEAGERVAEKPTVASFDSKSYKGSASFNVTAGVVNTTPIVVEAKICNAITNVTFGEGVEEAFNDGYQLSIGLNSNNLVYTASNAGTDGYFIIADDVLDPTLDWTFTGTLAKSGESFSKSGSFTVEQGKKYLMNVVYTEHNGVLKVIIRLDTSPNDKDDTIIFEPLSTGIEKTRDHEIWATHTTLHAIVDLETYNEEKVYFEYRMAGTDAWTKTAAATKISDNGDFSLLVSGLKPEAKYEYQLVLTPNDTTKPEERIVSEPINTITMKAAPQVPNASFEYTSKTDGYDIFHKDDALVPENCRTKWWDSGNSSASIASTVLTYADTGSGNVKDGKQSICLHSHVILNNLAAGNLYSGFMHSYKVAPVSGIVCFGRPFTGRPSKLRMWVKYTGGTGSATKNLSGSDEGQIKVALGNWKKEQYGHGNGTDDSPVAVNTADQSTFVDFANDPKGGTLAYGTAFIKADGTTTINEETEPKKCNDWLQITIPIEYFNTTTLSTHIIISCAASRYGDYFEGYKDSKLWVDGIELIYDSEITTK